jgi:phosphoadenosine phosphosulfate reductase
MPRRLLRDGAIVVDEWRTTGDGAAAVAEADALLLALSEFRAERERWLARAGPLGVILAPADDEQELVPDLARFALVAAEFTGLSEGRGYTQGRLLRERWGFAGELRARGAIHRDHVFLLARCGFNSFELPENEIETARDALATFSAAYQPANDAGLAVRLRHR